MGHRLHGSPFLNATQQYYKSVWRQKAPPTKKIANNFIFSITWRYHCAPRRQWRLRGAPTACHCALTEFWPAVDWHSHGALTACSWRAKSCHCASRAWTQHARRPQCVSMASSRSVYKHMRKQMLQAYCRNRHAYKRELSDVIYCLIFVDVDIGNFCVLLNYFMQLFLMLEKISEIIQ